MASGDPVLVTRDSWRVRYVEDLDTPGGVDTAWQMLESLLPSFTGRKFAGAFDAAAGWYRACVRDVAEPAPREAGLPVAEIPGGLFLRLRLVGDPQEFSSRLPAAFEKLHAMATSYDRSRPSLELYRSHRTVDALLPVLP